MQIGVPLCYFVWEATLAPKERVNVCLCPPPPPPPPPPLCVTLKLRPGFQLGDACSPVSLIGPNIPEFWAKSGQIFWKTGLKNWYYHPFFTSDLSKKYNSEPVFTTKLLLGHALVGTPFNWLPCSTPLPSPSSHPPSWDKDLRGVVDLYSLWRDARGDGRLGISCLLLLVAIARSSGRWYFHFFFTKWRGSIHFL